MNITSNSLKITIPALLLLCYAGWNLGTWSQDLDLATKARQASPFQFAGDQFRGLEPLFSQTEKVGYLTDKDPEAPLTNQVFSQAQYILAPSILVLNKTEYPFVILDFTSAPAAMERVKALGLVPLKASTGGLIVAANPHFPPGP